MKIQENQARPKGIFGYSIISAISMAHKSYFPCWQFVSFDSICETIESLKPFSASF